MKFTFRELQKHKWLEWFFVECMAEEAEKKGGLLAEKEYEIEFITYTSEMTNTLIDIIGMTKGHDKVLRCYDNNGANRWFFRANFTHNEQQEQENGTIESHEEEWNICYFGSDYGTRGRSIFFIE